MKNYKLGCISENSQLYMKKELTLRKCRNKELKVCGNTNILMVFILR
jgi:hypothetical protein